MNENLKRKWHFGESWPNRRHASMKLISIDYEPVIAFSLSLLICQHFISNESCIIEQCGKKYLWTIDFLGSWRPSRTTWGQNGWSSSAARGVNGEKGGVVERAGDSSAADKTRKRSGGEGKGGEEGTTESTGKDSLFL